MKNISVIFFAAALFVGMTMATDVRAKSERVLPVRAYAPDIPAGVDVTRTYFTATASTEEEILEFRRALIRNGARDVNLFLPDVIVCELPPSLDVSRLPGARGLQRIEESAIRPYSEQTGPSAAPARGERLAWIKTCYERTDDVGLAVHRSPNAEHGPFNDVVVYPDPEKIRESNRILAASGIAPATARLAHQNAEFWGGDILVQLVMPESNGEYESETEDWTDAQLAEAVSGAFAAMLDVQGQNPMMSIHYVFKEYRRADTGWEAIKHPMNDDQGWIMDVISRTDPSLPTDDQTTLLHAFNTKARVAAGTDFVFLGFIVNSENAPGHIFHGANYTAYASHGGPYNITPFPAGRDPNGLGHFLVFSKIFQHETAHCFWALDEYASAPGGECLDRSGYLAYQNLNRDLALTPDPDDCHPFDPFDCIMRYAAREDVGRPWCRWSRGQMGLITGDRGDESIPDIFEKKPVIEFQTPIDQAVEIDEVTIAVTVRSLAVPNQNPNQAADDRVDYAAPLKGAQYYATEGWKPLPALDGEWDEVEEEAVLEIKGLPSDDFTVRFKARTSVNLWSNVYKSKITYVGIRFSTVVLLSTQQYMRLYWEVDENVYEDDTYDVYRVDPGEAMPGHLVEENVLPDNPDDPGTSEFTFDDTNVTPGNIYRYYVATSYTPTGGTEPVTVHSDVVENTANLPIPQGDMLSHASPNPFTSETKLSVSVTPTFTDVQVGGPGGSNFQQRVASDFDATVFDVAGRRVKNLHKDSVLVDFVSIVWDGTNSNNVPVPSGVYFIRVVAGETTGVRKVLLIR